MSVTLTISCEIMTSFQTPLSTDIDGNPRDGREPQKGAGRRIGPDRKAIRQRLSDAPGRCGCELRRGSDFHRLARPRHRTGRWWLAAWPSCRDLWTGVIR